jgi:disulfide bond formation protein DsbB
MGAYVNSLGVNVMGWLLFAFMSLALVALLVSLRSG